MVGWIAAKPRRVLYLALAVISILVSIIEDHIISTPMRVIGIFAIAAVGSFLILLALGALYEKEDWDDEK